MSESWARPLNACNASVPPNAVTVFGTAATRSPHSYEKRSSGLRGVARHRVGGRARCEQPGLSCHAATRPGQQDVRVLVGARVLVVRAALLIAVAGLLAHSVVPAVRATAASAAVQQASVAPGVAAPAPLVDAAFLDEVRARLADAFRRDDDYAYRERRTEINTNPFGRVGTGEVELYEVYPSPTSRPDLPPASDRTRGGAVGRGVGAAGIASIRPARRAFAVALPRTPPSPHRRPQRSGPRPKPTTSSTCCSSASRGASCSRAGRRLW